MSVVPIAMDSAMQNSSTLSVSVRDGHRAMSSARLSKAIAAFSSLSDLTALWPYLDDQQRDTVVDVAQALAKANVSTPSTVDTSAQTPVKPR